MQSISVLSEMVSSSAVCSCVPETTDLFVYLLACLLACLSVLHAYPIMFAFRFIFKTRKIASPLNALSSILGDAFAVKKRVIKVKSKTLKKGEEKQITALGRHRTHSRLLSLKRP